MPRILGIVLIGAALGTAAASAASDRDEARSWLERMSSAIENVNYEGTFVYVHGSQLEAMRIVHGVGDFGHRERLLSLNGAPREIIRDDEVVTCILPDSQSVVVEKSRSKTPFPRALTRGNTNVTEHYRLMLMPGDRVAGRMCRILGVVPKDGFRYGYRFWLDNETGLPLRMDLMGEDGKPLEQVMFTDVRIGHVVKLEELQPVTQAEGYKWYRKTEKANMDVPVRAGRWRVQRLPAGFEEVERGWQSLPTRDNLVRHLVFSDGLASVSVYIAHPADERQSGEALEGLSQMGAVSAYGRVVDDHPVTVVGEVPGATVKMIGESITYQE